MAGIMTAQCNLGTKTRFGIFGEESWERDADETLVAVRMQVIRGNQDNMLVGGGCFMSKSG